MAAPLQRRSLLGEGILLVVICAFCVFPFYWMVTTSLKTQVVALQSSPAWIFSPTLANYWEVLFEDKVGVSLLNSIIVATVATNDTTLTSVQAVAAAGSFTLYANAAATAETRVNFLVIN